MLHWCVQAKFFDKTWKIHRACIENLYKKFMQPAKFSKTSKNFTKFCKTCWRTLEKHLWILQKKYKGQFSFSWNVSHFLSFALPKHRVELCTFCRVGKFWKVYISKLSRFFVCCIEQFFKTTKMSLDFKKNGLLNVIAKTIFYKFCILHRKCINFLLNGFEKNFYKLPCCSHSAGYIKFSMHVLKFYEKVYGTSKTFQNLHAASTREIKQNELSIFKLVFDSIIAVWLAFFCFEINQFNNFRGKSRFNFGRQHNFGLRATDFRGVWFRVIYGNYQCCSREVKQKFPVFAFSCFRYTVVILIKATKQFWYAL